MAKFKKPTGPRKRLTFYLTESQAKRLIALQTEATRVGLRLTFCDDFTTWMNHQLTLAEKEAKGMRKGQPSEGKKGGKHA